MGSTNVLTTKISTRKFKKNNINNVDANSRYFAFSNEDYQVIIYETNSNVKVASHDFNSKIVHIQFHPSYCNVISVSLCNLRVILCHIDTKGNKIEEKVEYLGSTNDFIYKTMFSPYEGGNTLATLFSTNIRIWNMNEYFYIYNIRVVMNNKNLKIKWNESGEFLIFYKNKTKIEVFSLKSKTIEYHLIYKHATDFFFLKKEKQMITIGYGLIILWDIINGHKIFSLNYEDANQDSFYISSRSLLYLLNTKKVLIYNLQTKKQIFNYPIEISNHFFCLKNIYNEDNLFSKLIIFTEPIEFCFILSILTTNQNIQEKETIKEANNDFWKKSIKKIHNNYEFLSYSQNKINPDEIKIKKYVEINEISTEFDIISKKFTLEEKRKMVADDMAKYKENENIEKGYLDYIKNIIKDNTNITLLTKYLLFLKKNEVQLTEKFQKNFESFNDEINQFKVCFTELILKQKLNYIKSNSEKNILLDLLGQISLLDSKNQDLLDQFRNEKEKELDKFRFNQPVSFEGNKELYFCRNRMIILYNLIKIIKAKRFDKFNNMKSCIKKILNGEYFDNPTIVNDKVNLTIIICIIAIPQTEAITDYNLNLIDNKETDVTEDQLDILGFKYSKSKNEYKLNNIIIKKVEMEKYNLKNIKWYINNNYPKNFKIYELYKFNYLKNYYSMQFDEDKLEKFFSRILISKVFQETFKFFYGNEIKYPFLDDNIKGGEKASKFFKKYIKFIPLKCLTTSAITEKFSMESYVFLNSELISSIFNENSTVEEKTISKALLNGSFVVIIDHELNHNFHNYYYMTQNGKESIKTTRKKEFAEREGGDNIERVLFGRVMNELTLRQALYILNEKNYSKSLNQFREEFLALTKEDCECQGIFEEYSKLKFNIEELSDYMVIRFKAESLNVKYIKIKIKDDVLGFPNYDDNTYMFNDI